MQAALVAVKSAAIAWHWEEASLANRSVGVAGLVWLSQQRRQWDAPASKQT
jgi:hypothetical protein